MIVVVNPVYHQRSKHIDIKYRWIRDPVSSEKVELIHIYTDEQTADVLTKHVEGSVFHKHVDRIMEDIAP